MCTIQSIRDAIQEHCQSQYEMEYTDIEQVLMSLPFSEHSLLHDQSLPLKHPYHHLNNCGKPLSF